MFFRLQNNSTNEVFFFLKNFKQDWYYTNTDASMIKRFVKLGGKICISYSNHVFLCLVNQHANISSSGRCLLPWYSGTELCFRKAFWTRSHYHLTTTEVDLVEPQLQTRFWARSVVGGVRPCAARSDGKWQEIRFWPRYNNKLISS